MICTLVTQILYIYIVVTYCAKLVAGWGDKAEKNISGGVLSLVIVRMLLDTHSDMDCCFVLLPLQSLTSNW